LYQTSLYQQGYGMIMCQVTEAEELC
jgi:hypothetical protein